MIKPDDMLIRFVVALESRMVIPEDISAWLLSGINDFVGGSHKTLCKALELRACGLASPAIRAKRKERNALIKEIAKNYEGTTYIRGAIIADNIYRWPYIEEKDLYSHLMELEKSGYWKIPGTPQGIREILDN
ncbi:MAG: hypothetical protein ABL919_08345 [Methylococcales bacterium]|nr:hypothetical protein [Methylococcaceae bacterium]